MCTIRSCKTLRTRRLCDVSNFGAKIRRNTEKKKGAIYIYTYVYTRYTRTRSESNLFPGCKKRRAMKLPHTTGRVLTYVFPSVVRTLRTRSLRNVIFARRRACTRNLSSVRNRFRPTVRNRKETADPIPGPPSDGRHYDGVLTN